MSVGSARIRNASVTRRVRTLVVVTIAVYLPSCWLLFQDTPWSSYHWSWIRMFPVLPGLILPAWQLTHDADSPLGLAIAGVATILFLAGLTWLGSRSRRSLVAAVLIALVLMTMNAGAEYQAYRM